MRIYLTGASGFVGKYIVEFFQDKKTIIIAKRETLNKIEGQVVIHLAGKAHDLKNVSSPDEYYKVNTELTKRVFDSFLVSKARVFITLSSVKAVADDVYGELSEEVIPNPITHYGKSKLLAEQYILSNSIPQGKRVYILRPCMIHGPGNKGNLNLLYALVSKGLPWPLGLFENSRSYLSIENLCFIIKELMDRENIPSGIYNVADDVPLSTNDIIKIIAESNGKKARILNINKNFIKLLAFVGNLLKLPLNSESLHKLTKNYIVSNSKIKLALAKQLPVSSKDGLIKTFQSFSKNA
ncbi:NAD-dependent epimerase/dehydratase family protein [Aquirufa rosea]|uniref:NAD-dependent epimerase/dehydratase family protein n=1 Tax=Aquirufa rosea TaxID=2509241 RepID=A0A4Q1BYS0_9BACT|nr:NAD-dependent epimerase/dehydratase family protein [Aquirufa rosea]RXK48262.1 NAD-dependent epimerase/dehydratase family protein [Aquirufa rosea]